MACYVSSNGNRLYAVLETSFGRVPAAVTANRFAALRLTARQTLEALQRQDRTGSRTFTGVVGSRRRSTTFGLRAYLTAWGGGAQDPAYSPLLQSALGGVPLRFVGGTAGPGSTASVLVFSAPHELSSDQAVVVGGELRFVSAVLDTTRVQLSAPLSAAPADGAAIGGTISYFPATDLPSLSLFDYWSPATAVHRIVCGATVEKLQIKVNGDFHEFQFTGPAQDLIDSATFADGQGGMTSFPDEPAAAQLSALAVPGHLGQAWLGSTVDRFFTVTDGTFSLDNQLETRNNEFGTEVPQCVSPGPRLATLDFSLYEQDNDATKGLYQAARQQSPVPVMFQLGQQAGQLFGVYLKSVVPEVPEFDDSDPRLQWRFRNSQAQGTLDDEMVVAFG